MSAGGLWIGTAPAAQRDPADRGLAYGDGVFETVRCQAGRATFWPAHWARLQAGCAALSIPLPAIWQSVIEDEIRARAGDPQPAVLKVIVTRGSGGRGYLPPEPATPTLQWQWHPFHPAPEAWQQTGIRVVRLTHTLPRQPVLAGFKHLNRLDQVLLRRELAQHPDAQEGWVCDDQGHLVEAVSANVFWMHGTTLFTPSVAHCGLRGVWRSALLALAVKEGLSVQEVQVPPETLFRAEAVWIGNSVQGLWPVVAWDDHRWPVGPWTARFQQEFEAGSQPV